MALEGASTPENIHHAFVFAKQHGCNFFSAAGKPTFTQPGCVAGVQQFVNLMGADKIVSLATPNMTRTSRYPTSPAARSAC